MLITELYVAELLRHIGFSDHVVNLIERTNKMQPCSRIYYSDVS